MSIIAMPAAAKIAAIEWSLDRPAQVNRSQWTGRDQVVADPWHARWAAEVELAPIIGEANVLAWRAFLAKLKGRVNSFRLQAVEAAQMASGSSPVVNGLHAAGVSSVAVSGFPASATVLGEGRFVTINDQLLMLTAALTTNASGQGTLQLHAPLREAAAGGTAIGARFPTAHVALTSARAGWSVGRGQLYGIRLSVEERY